jgi:glucose-6-phosphate 1-dehydrogenase
MSGRELSIVIVGASGDLALKKIMPAFFALYCQGLLPKNFRIVGFSRTPLSDADFRARAVEMLACRYEPTHSCEERKHEFLDRCFYVEGRYDSRESFVDLYQRLAGMETGASHSVNRLFFLAVPPAVFMDVVRSISGAGLVLCGEGAPWSRIVIEKPFGRDRQSSDELVHEMGRIFREDQTYRIDHYLGKEVIQNLLVLRFANAIFAPIWNREYIQDVKIEWAEDFGIERRGGYFDSYGIIRDVVQNHLLQMLALVAMEPPAGLKAATVRNEKVRVLKAIAPLSSEDLVIGQYVASAGRSPAVRGYRAEEGVRRDSRCPTYAAAVLQVRNPRWEGVPFFLSAGKALDCRKTEITIRFRKIPNNVFCDSSMCPEGNEMVIRIQPQESVRLRISSKVPGLDFKIADRALDLQYQTAFKETIPDAYETLLLDVINGDQELFIRSDELGAAWDILTPVLMQMDEACAEPEPYAFGSPGPSGVDGLRRKYGLV